MCRMWILVSWLLIPATICHYPGQLPSAPEPEDPEDREKAIEQEKLRKEAIREAEEKRRIKHKKLEEEREGVRQNIRDKVYSTKVTREDSWTNDNKITMCYVEKSTSK